MADPDRSSFARRIAAASRPVVCHILCQASGTRPRSHPCGGDHTHRRPSHLGQGWQDVGAYTHLLHTNLDVSRTRSHV